MTIIYTVQTFDDFDDFTESSTWDLEFTQLSPGKFRAEHIFLGDTDLQIGEVIYNRTLLQHGSTPGGFTFAITKDRAVGFDATSNRFIETQLPIHDELLAAEAERYVAVVITSSRAFGLAAESSAFTEINLGISETIKEIKLTYSKAIVRTSNRLLTFDASGLPWKEVRF